VAKIAQNAVTGHLEHYMYERRTFFWMGEKTFPHLHFSAFMLTNLELFKFTPGNHPPYTRLQVNNLLHVIPVLLSCSVSAPAPLDYPCLSFIQQLHPEPPGKHATSVALDRDGGRPNGLEFLSADITAIVALDCDRSLLFSQVLRKS